MREALACLYQSIIIVHGPWLIIFQAQKTKTLYWYMTIYLLPSKLSQNVFTKFCLPFLPVCCSVAPVTQYTLIGGLKIVDYMVPD